MLDKPSPTSCTPPPSLPPLRQIVGQDLLSLDLVEYKDWTHAVLFYAPSSPSPSPPTSLSPSSTQLNGKTELEEQAKARLPEPVHHLAGRIAAYQSWKWKWAQENQQNKPEGELGLREKKRKLAALAAEWHDARLAKVQKVAEPARDYRLPRVNDILPPSYDTRDQHLPPVYHYIEPGNRVITTYPAQSSASSAAHALHYLAEYGESKASSQPKTSSHPPAVAPSTIFRSTASSLLPYSNAEPTYTAPYCRAPDDPRLAYTPLGPVYPAPAPISASVIPTNGAYPSHSQRQIGPRYAHHAAVQRGNIKLPQQVEGGGEFIPYERQRQGQNSNTSSSSGKPAYGTTSRSKNVSAGCTPPDTGNGSLVELQARVESRDGRAARLFPSLTAGAGDPDVLKPINLLPPLSTALKGSANPLSSGSGFPAYMSSMVHSLTTTHGIGGKPSSVSHFHAGTAAGGFVPQNPFASRTASLPLTTSSASLSTTSSASSLSAASSALTAPSEGGGLKACTGSNSSPSKRQFAFPPAQHEGAVLMSTDYRFVRLSEECIHWLKWGSLAILDRLGTRPLSSFIAPKDRDALNGFLRLVHAERTKKDREQVARQKRAEETLPGAWIAALAREWEAKEGGGKPSLSATFDFVLGTGETGTFVLTIWTTACRVESYKHSVLFATLVPCPVTAESARLLEQMKRGHAGGLSATLSVSASTSDARARASV